MEESTKQALNQVVDGETPYVKEEIINLFQPIFDKIKKYETQHKKETAAFQIRLFLSHILHKKLLHQDLDSCFRVIDISLASVECERSQCSSSFLLYPLKLLCLLICFQSMKTLKRTINFCVERQNTFERLVERKATMNFLLTFNMLAKRLNGQEYLLGRLRKFVSSCLGMDTRSNFNIGGVINYSIQTHCRRDELDDGIKINEQLYERLWKVINVCQNPKLLLQTNGVKWANLKTDIEEILNAMKNQPIDPQSAKAAASIEFKDEDEYFFPKYVTSNRLFRYQLADPTFRRHILLQIGICLIGHYQLSKCKQQSVRAKNPILRNLSSNDQKWVGKTFEELITLLDIPVFKRSDKKGGDVVCDLEQSKKLAQCYRDILLREFHYVHWKHDRSTKSKACPSIVKKSQKTVPQHIFEETKTKDFGKHIPMGASCLHSLWKGNLKEVEALKETRPKLKRMLKRQIAGLIEDETDEFLNDTPHLKRRHDARFNFHTLRLLLRTDPMRVQKLAPSWEHILKKIGVNNPMFHLLRAENKPLGKVALQKIIQERKEAKSKKVKKTTTGGKEVKKEESSTGKEKSSTSSTKKRASLDGDEQRKTKRRKLDKSTLNKSLDEVGRYI